MQIIFNILATVFLFYMMIRWRKDTVLDSLIKTFLFILSMAGFILILKHFNAL